MYIILQSKTEKLRALLRRDVVSSIYPLKYKYG